MWEKIDFSEKNGTYDTMVIMIIIFTMHVHNAKDFIGKVNGYCESARGE